MTGDQPVPAGTQLAATVRELGLKRWLATVVGPDSARQMIRDAWVSLDRDETEY